MNKNMMLVCEEIDRLTTIEYEARPGPTRGLINELYRRARELSDKPLCLAAANALVEQVKPGDLVFISCGWVIDFWYTSGEICGMTGSAALARMLNLALNANVCFIAEKEVVPVFKAVAGSLGLRVFEPQDASRLGLPVISARDFPVDSQEAAAEAKRIMDNFKPAAVITLEKCSRNKKGVYHTGPGNDMSSTTAKIDLLVDEARARGVLTIGIGDLGNEIGFGKIRSAVEEINPRGATCNCPCGAGIASDVETDFLVMASSSNRGGYAVEAALALLTDNPGLMHDAVMEKRMITAAHDMGAIDSFTVSPTFTDGHGVPMEMSACVVELLRQLIQSQYVTFPMFTQRS